MGADLYIRQLFDPQYKKWQRKFYQAVAYRNRLPEDSPEREQAQKRRRPIAEVIPLNLPAPLKIRPEIEW
jgi:hypothetical protein